MGEFPDIAPALGEKIEQLQAHRAAQCPRDQRQLPEKGLFGS